MGGVFIVESPNKVAKIQGFLDELYGPRAWTVIASYGHWRGLPDMKGIAFADAVDTSTWSERWAIHSDKAAVRIGAALRGASRVLLASDADREGEAISWHVVDEFGLRRVERATYTEVTKAGIQHAVEHPRPLDVALVDAQRARAVLDYEIGLECSRRFWRFGAKSAGRVQSAALRIVVDREAAVRDFKVADFWTVQASYVGGFVARVATFERPSDDELDEEGEGADARPRLRPKRFASRDEADALVNAGRKVPHVVEEVQTKPASRKPPAPYKTSTLLADAAKRLKWKPEKTSSVAQALFEKGAVTYIRTDSVALSQEAVDDVRAFLAAHHPTALPAEPQRHADGKAAQGAHEAIRPVHCVAAAGVAELDADQRALYDLIKRRTVTSQSKSAQLERTTITIAPDGCAWRLVAAGTVVVDAGFLALGADDEGDDDDEARLPKVAKGQVLALEQLTATAGKTQPPPRFTVAALITYLERKGIGRPSTLAGIFETLTERDYIAEKKGRLHPTELGSLADRLMRVSFDALTQEKFTAVTEASLDMIAAGQLRRVDFLTQFHTGLQKMLGAADVHVADYAKRHPELDRDAVVDHDVPCVKCGAKMLRRRGKFGHYAQCTSESCGGRVSLEPLKIMKEPCPSCDASVVEQPFVKDGKRAKFFRCTSCTWTSRFKPSPVSQWVCHADAAHGLMLEMTRARDDNSTYTFFKCRVCDLVAWSGPKPPPCPTCRAADMRLRDGAQGKFWSCSQWKATGCKGTAPFVDEKPMRKRKRA